MSSLPALELKIPPVAVALLIAAAMWSGSLALSSSSPPSAIQFVVALTLAATGATVAVIGVVSFRRARTTVNPMNFKGTSSLVTVGIYRFTRNPMYLGILLVIVGLGVLLGSMWFLLGPVAFVLYMNRFQIKAEERVLTQLFGAPYTEYMASVRRWL